MHNKGKIFTFFSSHRTISHTMYVERSSNYFKCDFEHGYTDTLNNSFENAIKNKTL